MSTYGEKQIRRDEKDGHVIHQYGDRGFIHFPLITMWKLIEKKGMPPTRIVRYCCSELKEKHGNGRVKMTGVRWAESVSRRKNSGLVRISGKSKHIKTVFDGFGIPFQQTSKGGVVLNTDNDESRRIVESCYRTTSTLVNPIIDWTDEEVWEFLKQHGCNSNPLYAQGHKRIGCICCPMSGQKRMKKEAERMPKYKALYEHAFDRMIEERIRRGKECSWGNGRNGKEVFKWWVGEDPNQITMEDYMNTIDEEW